MRLLLTVAIVANAVITASCPLYLPPASAEDEVLMSYEVSQRCHAQEEGISENASAGCAGGQCIQNRPNVDEHEDSAPGQPLMIAALPAGSSFPDSVYADSDLPLPEGWDGTHDTHIRSVVLRC